MNEGDLFKILRMGFWIDPNVDFGQRHSEVDPPNGILIGKFSIDLVLIEAFGIVGGPSKGVEEM